MITELKLDHSAIPYIRSHLSDRNTLSQYLLKLPLEKGQAITYLPSNASQDAIRRFDVGGIIPSPPGLRPEIDAGENNLVPLQRTDVDLKLASYITRYLSQPGRHYAVFEHHLARPGDPWLSRAATKFFTFQSEVYFLLASDDPDLETTLTALKEVRTYSFTAILSSALNMPNIHAGQEVHEGVLQILTEATKHIIVGAYDGESEIIWSEK